MTEQMRNILASCLSLRGRDTLRIDFLQFIFGRNDLPFHASREHLLLPLLKRKLLHCGEVNFKVV